MWNDKETNIDLLGHDKIAQTIIEIIDDKHLRPLTIGVYGDWGIGKSSVVSLLQKRIEENNKAGSHSAHCIVFNGWLFQGYEDVKTALMETIISELASIQPRNKKIQKLAHSLIKRVNWLKVAKVSSNLLLTGMTGLPVGSLLNTIGTGMKKVKELISPEDKEDKDDESFIKDEEVETVTTQIHVFRKEFAKLIETSKVDQVIVLVDDLDRCLPKSVIEILESIRLFLFVEGTTFVLSADEKMIEYAVRIHFPDLPSSYTDYTRNYLEKLIQIPIRIPSLNRLQTENYIKFLMLQNHLRHNYKELQRIYSIFDAKKKTPYDNVELSYEIITEAFDGQSTELKETLLVGNQLSPTLSSGLNGNPRNIKRFLNTLFLRLRIAKMYGLEAKVRLDILAKLMLLERFQPEKFEMIISDVTSSQNGISNYLKEREENVIDEGSLGLNRDNNKQNDISRTELKFVEWINLSPKISDIDLHPYIFISRDKAISFDTNETFSQKLEVLYTKLSSGSAALLSNITNELQGLKIEEATDLFNRLESECKILTDLKNLTPQMKGVFKLMASFTEFESKVLDLLATYPPSKLGPWAISELSGVSLEMGQRRKLLESWSTASDNSILKSLAIQTLKK